MGRENWRGVGETEVEKRLRNKRWKLEQDDWDEEAKGRKRRGIKRWIKEA